jgi:uncharacterized repeat protein (TIGR04138 family)
MQSVSFEEVLENILSRDKRYHRDAYFFVREALDHTQKIIGRETKGGQARQHVTPKELLEGIRAYALEQFGPMAMTVFEEWNIRSCKDFGEIVFTMIAHNLLAKTERDTREDFATGYDFYEAFRKPFLPKDKAAGDLKESRAGKLC